MSRLRSQGRPHWACPPHPGWSTVCRQEGLILRGSQLGSGVSGLPLPDFYLQGRQDLLIKEGSDLPAKVTASQGPGVQPASLSPVFSGTTASQTRSSVLYVRPTFLVLICLNSVRFVFSDCWGSIHKHRYKSLSKMVFLLNTLLMLRKEDPLLVTSEDDNRECLRSVHRRISCSAGCKRTTCASARV